MSKDVEQCRRWAQSEFKALDERVREMENNVRGWNRWIRGGMASLILAILGSIPLVWAVATWAGDMEASSNGVRESVQIVRDKVATMSQKQDKLQQAVRDNIPAGDEVQKELIKQALEEALEASATSRHKRRP